METLKNIINILLIPILPSLAVLLGLYIQKLIQKAKAELEIAEGSQVAIGAYKKRTNANEAMAKAKAAGLDPYLLLIYDPKGAK